jgi:hypothetical protein
MHTIIFTANETHSASQKDDASPSPAGQKNSHKMLEKTKATLA